MINFPKNVDFSKISYGNVKTNENGGKSIYIGYNGTPLIIQTPKLSTPFGMSVYNKDIETTPGEVIKYSAPVNITEDNLSCVNFKKFLAEFDKKIIEDAVTNSKDWLGKAQKEKVISAFYNPLLNYPKDKETGEVIDKYDPKFKIPLLVKDGTLMTSCYNDDGESVQVNNVPSKSSMRAILQCMGIWVVGKRFGVSWKVMQLIVEEPASLDNYIFSDDEEEDEIKMLKKSSGTDDDDYENQSGGDGDDTIGNALDDAIIDEADDIGGDSCDEEEIVPVDEE